MMVEPRSVYFDAKRSAAEATQVLHTPEEASQNIIRLFSHEALRVFADRLIDDPDRTWVL